MISLGTRYIDYGLTGGFFIFVGLILFGFFNPATAVSILGDFQKIISAWEIKGFETLLNGILASLFVVTVFATGLLLDLIGAVFIVWEADIFRRHFDRNKSWLQPLLARYDKFLGDDVNQFLTFPQFWKLKTMFDPRLALRPLMLISSFGRIESILLSHLLLTADRTKIEFVLDRLHTCRIARAVTSGLYLLILAFVTMWMFRGIFELSVIALVPLVVGTVLSTFVIRRAYSKFCSSLFASSYVLLKTNEGAPKSGLETRT